MRKENQENNLKNKKKIGTLFVVSTPIGNLKDITVRAIEVLNGVDLIAAEDTRTTKKLLQAYTIKSRLISYREENRERITPVIIGELLSGSDCALTADAGTPAISDPGFYLIDRCVENGIDIVPIPGPSAITASLVASGIDPSTFVFWGFLPKRGAKRKKILEQIKNDEKTSVFFESPARIISTLSELRSEIGERKISLCRELTKIHEEVIRGNIDDVIKKLEERGKIKGEIVIVVSGKQHIKRNYDDDEVEGEINRIMKRYRDKSTKEIATIVSEKLKLPGSRVYRKIIQMKNNQKID